MNDRELVVRVVAMPADTNLYARAEHYPADIH
jgi:hypothetical protein